MLRLLLEGATRRSPAPGQVNLQAAAHVNRAESLFLRRLLLLCSFSSSHRVLQNMPVPHSFRSNLDRAPAGTGKWRASQSWRLDVGGSPLWDLPPKQKKMKRKKKYQERKCGVPGVLVMVVCGNPASVLSSLNTHCIKMYTLTHTLTHAHPPTHRKRQGVRLLHSGSLASSQPLNTSTAQYSLLSGKLWVTCWPFGNLTSEDYPATPASATVTYTCRPFIHFPHS